jgi:uncharacterized membrane protein
MNLSERVADKASAIIGSWRFILIQSTILVGWVIFNVVSDERFDEYPFILLNLFLSIQAAFTGPILLLSANRQAEIDRRRAIETLEINRNDHIVIVRMEQHLDMHFDRLAQKLGIL